MSKKDLCYSHPVFHLNPPHKGDRSTHSRQATYSKGVRDMPPLNLILDFMLRGRKSWLGISLNILCVRKSKVVYYTFAVNLGCHASPGMSVRTTHWEIQKPRQVINRSSVCLGTFSCTNMKYRLHALGFWYIYVKFLTLCQGSLKLSDQDNFQRLHALGFWYIYVKFLTLCQCSLKLSDQDNFQRQRTLGF